MRTELTRTALDISDLLHFYGTATLVGKKEFAHVLRRRRKQSKDTMDRSWERAKAAWRRLGVPVEFVLIPGSTEVAARLRRGARAWVESILPPLEDNPEDGLPELDARGEWDILERIAAVREGRNPDKGASSAA